MPKDSLTQNAVAEWTFRSEQKVADPFNGVDLDVVFSDGKGSEKKVPAFWAGGRTWRVRFAAHEPGDYQFRTACSNADDGGLHGREGQFRVVPYAGSSLLRMHGPVQVAADRRHFEHQDGTPFFWLGDTWWMGLCKRLPWPKDFKALIRDRVKKGFSVIQIVAGLYPDMPPFDERGENEAGTPWKNEFTTIRPSYFDAADRRIEALVSAGLVPCIVGCWGYFLEFMGAEMMKKHWRYLVARYGAYPVIWCIAGEAVMPYYVNDLGADRKSYMDRLRSGWTDLTRTVRSIDGFQRPVTIHPTNLGHEMVDEPALLDFDMLQTGHGSLSSLPNTLRSIEKGMGVQPTMPVLVGEVCYEGILEMSREEIQRLMFWACMLSGAAGHTYGANGLWQLNGRKKPFGPSPHGSSWGDTPWKDAAELRGSKQVGLGRKLFESFPWWQIQSHPEWIEAGPPPAMIAPDAAPCYVPLAAGIPGSLRILYTSPLLAPLTRVKGLEAGAKYRASLFNPSSGQRHELGPVEPDVEGNWSPPKPPVFRDWVWLLEGKG